MTHTTTRTWLSDLRMAQTTWGRLPSVAKMSLKRLVQKHHLSVVAGDLQCLEGKWYVTHSGLLRIAERRRCFGIVTSVQSRLSEPDKNRWIFKAIVYKTPGSKGFVGYGDADPSNTSRIVRGAELRVAETRAVNRALRKAYGIGICSVEELGDLFGSGVAANGSQRAVKPQPPNGSYNGQPRLKDKLCLLIRQHNLDPTLVKAYAAHFCGTETLSGASRELVESFIAHLEKEARENRDGLLCKLNSFSQPVKVHS
jgi:hypothetical protein